MEPLNDDELNEFLLEWRPPATPAGLRPPSQTRFPWLRSGARWLVSGTLHVPVPVGILAVLILAFTFYWAVSASREAARPAKTVTLSDFQPVKQLQPRIIRSDYEAK